MSGNKPSIDTEFEGYSDYHHVSQNIVETISDAVQALGDFRGADLSGAKLKGERAAMHSDVLNACWQLRVELEHEATGNEDGNFADEILANWYGETDDENGWVDKIETTPTMQLPDKNFLGDLAHSLRRAGWELGYLRAGRETETGDRGGDAGDAEVTELIGEMNK